MTLPTAGTWRFHPLDRPCPLPQTASFLLPSKYRATHTSPRSPGRRQIPAPTQCTLYPLVGSCGRPHPYSQPYYPDAGEKCRGSQTDNHKYQSVENLSMPAFCFALRSKRRVLSMFKAILFPDFSEVAGCGLHCAHRATAVLSWGPCEHRDHTSYLAFPFFSSPRSPPTLLQGWAGLSSIARVERAHSYCARSASRRTTRLLSLPLAVLLSSPYTQPVRSSLA